jgi:hypothetical protein
LGAKAVQKWPYPGIDSRQGVFPSWQKELAFAENYLPMAHNGKQ